MDISTISLALTGLKNAFDITSLAIASRDKNKISEAPLLFNDKIIEVQSACLYLQQQLSLSTTEITSIKSETSQLKTQITQLKEKLNEKSRYILDEMDLGAFAYKLKAEIKSIEPSHYICQPCMDIFSKKCVLKLVYDNSKGAVLKCPSCKNALPANRVEKYK